MSYRGLILDFGGVVTTDFYGGLSAFCVREGLGPDAFVQAIRTSAEGRAALKAVERGELPQREFERVLGRLLGVDDAGLLARALADIQPPARDLGMGTLLFTGDAEEISEIERLTGLSGDAAKSHDPENGKTRTRSG
jgi:hypothetical protein